MFWVLYTCVLRRLAPCKRNQLNPFTRQRENVQNVVRFSHFRSMTKYANISARFRRFPQTGWSDWADSFCIVPGVSRHKFRVPTTRSSENFGIPLFGVLTPPWGVQQIFFDQNKKNPSVLRSIGHHIINLLYKLGHILSIWQTLVLHTQADSHLSTKLTLDGYTLDQIKETKLLGVRIQDDLKWSRNTTEEQWHICICILEQSAVVYCIKD